MNEGAKQENQRMYERGTRVDIEMLQVNDYPLREKVEPYDRRHIDWE